MTFLELLKRFPDEQSCIDYYLKIRYPDGVHCNHCGSPRVYMRKTQNKAFDCYDCKNTFSPFKDTIFEHSSTDMRKWFYAIHLFLNGKKGISALQLQREIGVTYKTAWRMLQQIRTAMGNTQQKEFFDTIIEMDETYVGGKPRKDNDHDDLGSGGAGHTGRATSKTPVIGAVDRYSKRVYARVSLPDKDGRRLSFKQLLNVLEQVSKPENGNTIITDELSYYNPLADKNYIHLRVNHKTTYASGEVHTNNIESFWATLKRGVYGIYHHVSVKHMQRYVDEFCFRYNNRNQDMFSLVLGQARI